MAQEIQDIPFPCEIVQEIQDIPAVPRENEMAQGIQDINLLEDPREITETSVEPYQLQMEVDTIPTGSDLNPRSHSNKPVYVPSSPDFLMSYSTLPERFSYRDPERGSLYVQALIEELKPGRDVERALKRVTGRVREMLAERGQQEDKVESQLPFHLTTGMENLIRFWTFEFIGNGSFSGVGTTGSAGLADPPLFGARGRAGSEPPNFK